jgi:hypothetical protein
MTFRPGINSKWRALAVPANASIRRHTAGCAVGTLECTSGRELLTVVDAAKLTVVCSSRAEIQDHWLEAWK